jgi:hypothetical protein
MDKKAHGADRLVYKKRQLFFWKSAQNKLNTPSRYLVNCLAGHMVSMFKNFLSPTWGTMDERIVYDGTP